MTGRQGTPWSVRCNIIRFYSTSGGTNGWMGWGVGVVGIGGGGGGEVWGVPWSLDNLYSGSSWIKAILPQSKYFAAGQGQPSSSI